ncbi:segregation and condensation protein A [Candidatus Planktophila sulfonica]|uniref:segregation and condensation protein A n=1 Tax=Candidatus Planktophila sulfonica TaxID=1884904 RepID=UPI000BAC5BB6|nr:segregation/condensation protein A [Candidatus Planktophila sulfonica]
MESLVTPEEITSEQAESIAPESGFSVHLDNFDGPFDLLLQLISRHKLDITEISLSIVTDEFIAFIRALEASGEGWRLDQATEFLVIAATLLDLKAARLLPSGEIEDEEDLALLEARDILFARLLQYRAFKEVAASFQDAIANADKSFPRVVALDPALASLLPEVLIGVGAQRFAAIAERVLTPKSPPVVAVEHLHSALVSVTEESKLVVEALRKGRTVSFRNLVQGADSTLVVVARFLALLDLYRQGALRFEQVIALGELQISWVGSDEGDILVTDEFDVPVVLDETVVEELETASQAVSEQISDEYETEEDENV